MDGSFLVDHASLSWRLGSCPHCCSCGGVELVFELIVVAALVSGGAVDYFVEDVVETRREGSGVGVSDCSRAAVPAGSVVIGSVCEVPPHRPPPLRGGGCSESRRDQSL